MAGPRLLYQLAQEADDDVRESVQAQLLASAQQADPDSEGYRSYLVDSAGTTSFSGRVEIETKPKLESQKGSTLTSNNDHPSQRLLLTNSDGSVLEDQLPMLPPPYSASAKIAPMSSLPAYPGSNVMQQPAGSTLSLSHHNLDSHTSVIAINMSSDMSMPCSNITTPCTIGYYQSNLHCLTPCTVNPPSAPACEGSTVYPAAGERVFSSQLVESSNSPRCSLAPYSAQHQSSPAGELRFSNPPTTSVSGAENMLQHGKLLQHNSDLYSTKAYLSSPSGLTESDLRLSHSYPDMVPQLRNSNCIDKNRKQMTPPFARVDTYDSEQRFSTAVWRSPDLPSWTGSSSQHHDQSIIHTLSEENRALRSELEGYIRKTFKLQQLELHYNKVQLEYDELVSRQDKREKLEQHVVERLQREMVRLRERNRELTDQVELVSESARQEERSWEDELQHELSRRNFIISELVTQNQELQATKYRHEIELEAQRSTLEEQRSHIQLLDTALNNQQDRCAKLEQELKAKTDYEQRCVQLERALQAVREATERREESHRKHRAQLEKQLAQLHLQKSKQDSHNVIKKPAAHLPLDPDCVIINRLQEELDRKEFELQNAQAELLVMDHSHGSSSKDDRKSSDEDRKSSESDSRKSNEDKWATIKKINEMEMKIKGLEDRVAEKDAMIKVLRRHNTSDHAISPQLWGVADYSGSLTNKTRWRLEAVKKRLVSSPRDSTTSPFSTSSSNETTAAANKAISSTASDSKLSFLSSAVYHKLSIDHSAMDSDSAGKCFSVRPHLHHHRGLHHLLGETAVAGPSHSRTQSSCESCMYGDLRSGAAGFSVPTTPAMEGYIKRPQIYTLPTVRKARGKGSIDCIRGRSSRPKSADDHLLHGVKNNDRVTNSSVKDSSNDIRIVVNHQEDDEDSGSKTESAEQLYHC